jgi:hypothetical protein
MLGASAKESETRKPPARTFSNLALPISGVPFALETIEEYTTRLPDGTAKRDVGTVKTYRDAMGRMRIERNVDSPDGPVPMIQIFDYEEGFMALLDTGSKIAHRVTIPKKPEHPGAQPRFMILGGPLVALSGEKKSSAERLGSQTIAGAEFEGHRLTTTIEGEPSLVGIQEHWMSVELGLIGSMSSSGPGIEETVRIQRLDRTDPDPALFVIPGDYSVQNLGSLDTDV